MTPTGTLSPTTSSNAEASSGVRSLLDIAALPRGVIDGGEIVLLAIKPSLWHPILDALPWLAVNLTFAVVFASFDRTIPGLTVATTVQLFLFLCAARLGVALLRWIPTWYVLTNRRILEIQRIRQPQVVEFRLVDLRDVYVKRSLPERLTRLGTLAIVTDRSTQSPWLWRSIANAESVGERIRRAVRDAVHQSDLLT